MKLRERVWILALVVLLVVCGVVISFILWDWPEAFWDWLTDGESGSATIRNLGLVLAGIIALPLAIWRGVVADRQASAAQRQAETALEQADTAHRSLLNERYQQGAEMLGNAVLSVRIGGIYALERLAKESPYEYHVQIMKLLCAFARHPTEDEDYQNKLAERNADLSTPYSQREDVRAAMEFIGSRDETRVEIETSQGFRLDLIGADLSHAQIGDANLSGSMLRYANLSNAEISSVNLSRAHLQGAVMKNAHLMLIDFTDARASDADLSGATMLQLTMPSLTLDNANLSGAQLNGVDLSGGFIQYANLSNVGIRNSNLSDTHFLESDLSRARILKSKLSGAEILRTKMFGAILRDTDLSGTYFYDPHGGTATSPVTGLTQAQLDEACADPDNPPKLDGVLDAVTGKPLVWRGQPCHKNQELEG